MRVLRATRQNGSAEGRGTRARPGGFDVVFDGIGEDDYRRSFAALKCGGLLCAFG